MKVYKSYILLFLLFLSLFFVKVNALETNGVKLNSFEIKTKELYQEEKIYFDADIEGDVEFVAITAAGNNSPIFYISTNDVESGYFDLSAKRGNTYQGTGNFVLTGVSLGIKGGVIYYSPTCKDRESDTCVYYDFGEVKFTINEKKEGVVEDNTPVYDFVFTMDMQEVYPGDKVNVSFGSPGSINGQPINPKPVSNVMLSFYNRINGEILNVYLHSLDDKPYFIVPSTTSVGTYRLNYGYLTFTDGTSEKYQNRVGKVFSYEGDFEVKEKELDKTNYSFNNEDFDLEIKDILDELNDDAIITINANNSPIVFSEIFDSIKSTNRTLFIDYENMRWVFNGKDIKNPKTIEVSINLEQFSADNVEFLKGKDIKEAAILEFNNNGDLPGKTLIKLESNNVERFIDSDILYVYYVDEANKTLSKVAMEVHKNNGFYEFYINHNSKYILSSKEIDLEEDIKDDSVLDTNTTGAESSRDSSKKSNKIYFVCIGLVILIILVIVILLIFKKKKNKKASEETPVEETTEVPVEEAPVEEATEVPAPAEEEIKKD